MGELHKQRWTYLDLGEVVEADDLEVTICVLPTDNDGIGNLLAAAPDLLSSLKKIVESGVSLGGHHRALAIAAIAKALGQDAEGV